MFNFKNLKTASWVSFLSLFATIAAADDIDMFTGQAPPDAPPLELVFLLDTSFSMSDPSKKVNALEEGVRATRLNVLKAVMAELLSKENDIIPDNIRVGVATFNSAGGAIVQPVRAAGEEIGDQMHRDILNKEVQNLYGNGWTPLLGAILEVGMYVTGGDVVFGRQRYFNFEEPADAGYSSSDIRDPMVLETRSEGDLGYTYGQSSRVSALETIDATSAASYQLIYNEPVEGVNPVKVALCETAITADPILGRYNGHCIHERWALTSSESKGEALDTVPLKYNEGINYTTSCEGEQSSNTHVILLSDGESSNEDLGRKIAGRTMSEWVGEFLDDADSSVCADTLKINTSTTTAYRECVQAVASRFQDIKVKLHVVQLGVNSSLLSNIAQWGGGESKQAGSYGELIAAFEDIIRDAQSEVAGSALSSPSVSVNPNAVLAHSSDIYYPVFESSQRRLWYGNLKKYRIADVSESDQEENFQIVDQRGAEALDESACEVDDPRERCFKANSKSFWSKEDDGKALLKGGAAANQEAFTSRDLFIQGEYGIDKLRMGATIESDATDAAARRYYATLFGLDYQRLSVEQKQDASMNNRMKWLAGSDVPRFDETGSYSSTNDGDASVAYTERTSVLTDSEGNEKAPTHESLTQDERNSRLYYGASIHSEPVVVNYNFTKTNNGYEYEDVVYIGGNDGFLRAIDTEDGTEKFSFYPYALVPNIESMYKLEVGDFQYGFDATWTPWRQDIPDPVSGQFDGKIHGTGADSYGFVRLMGGMRRGGHNYYFLDVTNPEDPELLKEIKGAQINESASPFRYMGQTWSQPALAKVKLPGASAVTVVSIFGGGFDVSDDVVPDSSDPCATDGIQCGNQIYMVHAGNYLSNSAGSDIGDVIWWASAGNESSTQDHYSRYSYDEHDDMTHPIAAKVKVLDKNQDGLADHIYVGDLGGQIWRVDIDNDAADMAGFASVHRIASFSGRAFFETPSIAMFGNQAGIAIASGHRNDPNDEAATTPAVNKFYFLRDDMASTAEFTDTNDANGDGVALLSRGEETEGADKLGFSYVLTATGEKAFGSPVILDSKAFFATYIPPEDGASTNDPEEPESSVQCEPSQIKSRLTGINLLDGSGLVFRRDGTIGTEPQVGEEAYVSDTMNTIPFNGAGTFFDGDSFKILSGTKSFDLPLTGKVLKKVRWEHLGSGKDYIPDYTSQ